MKNLTPFLILLSAWVAPTTYAAYQSSSLSQRVSETRSLCVGYTTTYTEEALCFRDGTQQTRSYLNGSLYSVAYNICALHTSTYENEVKCERYAIDYFIYRDRSLVSDRNYCYYNYSTYSGEASCLRSALIRRGGLNFRTIDPVSALNSNEAAEASKTDSSKRLSSQYLKQATLSLENLSEGTLKPVGSTKEDPNNKPEGEVKSEEAPLSNPAKPSH